MSQDGARGIAGQRTRLLKDAIAQKRREARCEGDESKGVPNV